MNNEEVQKFNAYLHNWYTGNKRLMKYAERLPVLYYNGSQIMVDLNALSIVYHEKFLLGKLGAYANNFLDAVCPGIINFFNTEGIKLREIVFHFKFSTQQLIKHVNVPDGKHAF